MDSQSKRSSYCSTLLRIDPDASLPKAPPVDIEVHGLKAKVLLNRPQEDIIPAKYLQKADQSCCGRKFIFEDAARAQGKVLYALLDEILTLLDINREMDDHRSYFFLRPRLLNCHMEYWTGYRQKHQDAPLTAGMVCIDSRPSFSSNKSVLPISTTTKPKQSLESALEGKFKLLLTHLLLHIHRLHPPGDKFPDQEVFLIGLHGSRLHILRAIFPGYKTSRIWSGRHNPSSNTESERSFTQNPNERFYSRQNVERVVQQVEWHKLSKADGERNFRAFRVLGSQEYNLWINSEFRAAVRLIVGLTMYLMSGNARCGVLQHVFQRFPYDEVNKSDSARAKGEYKFAKEQEDVVVVVKKDEELGEMEKQKLEKDQERARTRDTMLFSSNDQIQAFEGIHQSWWDWVWEDENGEGCAKKNYQDVTYSVPDMPDQP
ncbi:hypothetical protein P170DRAFT_492471 [Aspergillus steynii IBT 23096]|uniref:Uncharacterized protein n=1 Tax=Aspergillus steynii IBT 23096 TaxID=1392250 RepID=A0A2I2GCM3_9EURO|nr:uncharacterized protein P170DRAFT_492471 [Aspergillus steynii IBT 23096]PLB50587.1 hypothetical protein P170DRAFT_492471 [Aspergillus steynii IBT 23096]